VSEVVARENGQLSLRDVVNRNPAATAGVLIVAIAGIIAATVWQVRSLTPSKPGAYYTIDDGKNWFKDDPQRITPFEYRGKQAVRAHLFRAADGKEFVGYLTRHTPQAAEVIRKVQARKPTDPPPTPAQMGIAQAGREFKRPGDAEWVPLQKGAAVQQITNITGPDGTPAVEVE
jgi:hypothetical protein